MNEDKKTKLKQSLEDAQRKLDELKSVNPNGNYEELERLIQKMNAVLYHSQSSKLTFIKLIKIFFILIMPYLFCVCSVVVVFGFMNFILNPIEPILYVTIVPITSLIFYLTFRIINIILNKIEGMNSILFLMCFGAIFVLVLAYIDQTWIHLCKNFSDSLLLCFCQVIMALLMDLFCTQKLFYYLGDIE